ncbi:cytochrome P450 [Frankia sp. CNm7]|uniref:Cytochrome P450 n=1 Tax=Frankia nepalensis TaxID=1836974 RepID=A0A937RJ39_9ACTN|nr:cytochrome P450 [Frankia nepalensis]MBL7501780.1 cytochrome P450 [Frankia nepalensis]MBL7515510.1 cytochrome P450 [Frankia nepalensis]MBL7523272.1 cytochrome P450 [Frankia nepalensis]MBL7628284.1 cytochrome P450 [Frankia nepalensis]
MTAPTVRPDLNLLDGHFYAGEHGDPRAVYAWLRANEPVFFDEGSGLWGVASYAAVLEAEKSPRRFSSAHGSRPRTGQIPHMIDMDDPEHTKRRKLVNRGFTPRRVGAKHDYLVEVCDLLIDAVCEAGECDFVRDLAAPLPMIVIGDMLGVAPEDRAKLLRWSDDMLSALDINPSPELVARTAEAYTGWNDHITSVVESRKAEPTDDLVSVLVHAEVDGDRLSDQEVKSESLLILIGGDETTRHVLSGGMEALLLHPDQKALLLAEPARIPAAVEEMLRWVSPIKNMNRTVVADETWYGKDLKAGQQMLLLYESANFDEERFENPERFDVTRTPNDHLAFGFGTHFCLGNQLARHELTVMFGRLLDRLPDMELATDAPLSRRAANFVSGIESMPVRFTPSAPLAPGR